MNSGTDVASEEDITAPCILKVKPVFRKTCSPKFRLFNADGTMNTGGPGYRIDRYRNIVITAPNVYHKNVEKYLNKMRYRELKRKNDVDQLIFLLQTFGIE
jgi:hypothetical protein